MTSNKNILVHNNQDFQKIRDDCLKAPKCLWEDVPYEGTCDGCTEWDWRRPGEIVNKPRFVKGDIKERPLRFNLNNLNLGESTYRNSIKHNLAALSVLTLNSKVFRFVVPEDNVEFSDDNYVGLFHFRVWRFGKFYDVVVDDRLPTHQGKLVSYLHDGSPEEFWPFLIEKAYTKLCGQTETLSKITIPDFIVDLTGGVSEIHTSLGHTKPLVTDLDSIICKAFEKESFIIFGRRWHTNVKNMEMENVYCITKAVYVDTDKSERILLLRVFMPFITETKEWNGPWSEGSDEWQSISQAEKENIGKVQKHEFWMPFSEFNKHDWDIYVIYLIPYDEQNVGGEQNKSSTWHHALVEGKWIKGVSSGGCRRDYIDTFYLNPQYSISLKAPGAGILDCTMFISVLQKTHKSERVPMDFYIFGLKQETGVRLDWDFFKHNKPIIDSFPHDDTREVTRRLNIPPGEYCIIVAPNKPYYEAHFLFRVFAAQSFTMSVLNEKVAQKDIDVRVSLTPSLSELESVQEFDKKVRSFFEEVSGEEQVVGWKGLKKVLDFAMDYEKPKSNNYVVRNSMISYMFPSKSVFDTMDAKEFSKDVTRSLLATADLDHSGKLTLQEFQGLWSQIRQWIQIYEMHSDENGFLPKEQLREALDSAGFQLNSDILCSLAIRYSNRDDVIPFDDFLMCTSKLRTVFDYYRYKDPEYTDQAAFTIEEWLQKSIYS